MQENLHKKGIGDELFPAAVKAVGCEDNTSGAEPFPEYGCRSGDAVDTVEMRSAQQPVAENYFVCFLFGTDGKNNILRGKLDMIFCPAVEDWFRNPAERCLLFRVMGKIDVRSRKKLQRLQGRAVNEE